MVATVNAKGMGVTASHRCPLGLGTFFLPLPPAELVSGLGRMLRFADHITAHFELPEPSLEPGAPHCCSGAGGSLSPCSARAVCRIFCCVLSFTPVGAPTCELNAAISESKDSQPPHCSAGHRVFQMPAEPQHLAGGDAVSLRLELRCALRNFCVKRPTIKLAEKFLIPRETRQIQLDLLLSWFLNKTIF